MNLPSTAPRATAALIRSADARPDLFRHLRLERTIHVLRFLAAALILAFGQAIPNVGPVFVIVLGTFFVGYALLVASIWHRVRAAADMEWADRFTVAADVSLVGFALLVFAPDPGWAIYGAGFLVIASGGFRFRSGALLTAASLSLTYVMVTVYRGVELGIWVGLPHFVMQVGSYIVAGVVISAVLPEIDAMRQREMELYEPILRAQEETGEALVITEQDRPVYWNHAFEALSGYGGEALGRGLLTSDLIVVDAASLASATDHGTFRAQVITQTGRCIPVEASHPRVADDHPDRRVWLLRDVSERERETDRLRDHALHDPLTRLPNRALLEDRLATAIAAAHRTSGALGVLLLDLDGFKAVNDSLGHKAGDRVLTEVASRIGATIRESDTAARLGGDEFVVVLPTTPLVGTIETARQLSTVISEPIQIGPTTRAIGVSIGIAVFPDCGEDVSALLAAADAAMYEAKRGGGGLCSSAPALVHGQP